MGEVAALYTANPDSKIKLITGDTGRGTYLLNELHDQYIRFCYYTSHIICFYMYVGVFKAPEQVDIFVDLKKISQLYSTVVSC